MKKYSDIPLKERKRNAERCYRHEENLKKRNIKRLIKEKERQCNSEYKTDKDREFVEIENEVLKVILKGGE